MPKLLDKFPQKIMYFSGILHSSIKSVPQVPKWEVLGFLQIFGEPSLNFIVYFKIFNLEIPFLR